MDETKLNEFVGRFVGDLGAVLHATTVLIGDRLGLYRAMVDGEPVTPAELAARTGCDERYLTEWLAAQAASGYTEYDADAGTYRLSEEQAFALTSEDNPVFVPGGLQIAASTIKDVELLAEAVRTGRGWPGASTTRACSAAPSGSSRRTTSAISLTGGCRRWTVWSTSWRREPGWPTSAAGTAHRRS